MVARVLFGAWLFWFPATLLHAQERKVAQYLVHYADVAQRLTIERQLTGSEYKILKDASDLGALLIEGPIGIRLLRAYVPRALVERSAPARAAQGEGCGERIDPPK